MCRTDWMDVVVVAQHGGCHAGITREQGHGLLLDSQRDRQAADESVVVMVTWVSIIK